MYDKLKEKLKESLTSVLPITLIVLALSLTLVPMEVGTLALFLAGAALLILGMGAEMAMTPLGRGLGTGMIRTKKLWLIVLGCFFMGFIITVAEPDLQVLANQVASIPNKVLIYTIAVGVGLFLVLAFLRIYFKVRLSTLLMLLYGLLLAVSFFAPAEFVPVAFDSGGVTTGPMTVPFIMTLGVGFCAVRTDRDSANDSFGLIALCSIGPILMVLLLSIFYHPEEATYEAAKLTPILSTHDMVREFLYSVPHYMQEVCLSILPVVGVFLLFQVIEVDRIVFNILESEILFSVFVFID